MTKEIVNCPMCQNSRAHLVRRRADIVKCEGCAVTYLRTRPSIESMVARYQTYADGASHMKLPVAVDEIRSSGLRREYFMQEILSLPGILPWHLLDIGCGWGAFMVNAREKGFDPIGVEICQKMAGFAETVLGLKVFTGQVEKLPKAQPFQIITAIHVLEHLPHPAQALNAVNDLLQPGGLFCGIVPNFASKCSQVQKDGWPWLDPEMHYLHFTPETLTQHLERHGFDLIKLYTHTGDFDPAVIAAVLREESNVPMSDAEITGRIEELWKKNLGEEIRFFAKKK